MNNKKRIFAVILSAVLLTGCAEKNAQSVSSAQPEVKRITLTDIKDMTAEYSDDDKVSAVRLLKKSLSISTDEEASENADEITLRGQKVRVTADPQTVDTTVLGSTDVTFTFAYESSGLKQTDQKKVKVTVEDTQAPVIHASHQYEVRVGHAFRPEKVIAEVVDPVDGPLKLVSSEPEKIDNSTDGSVYEEGWYTVSNNVNSNRTGTYTMTVHAVDKHGLSSDDDTISIIVNARSWTDSRYTPTYDTEDDDEEDNKQTEPSASASSEASSEPEVQPTAVPSQEPVVQPSEVPAPSAAPSAEAQQ